MNDRSTLDALSALAHGTRLNAYRLLRDAGEEGLSAGEVADRSGVPPTSLSGHLAILARAGLVVARRQGRRIVYTAAPERVQALVDSLLDRGPGGQRQRS